MRRRLPRHTPTRRHTIRGLRRRIHRQNHLRAQLETDQRTYGSIGRENSPTFAGWKETPVIDLIAVLNDERAYEVMLKPQQSLAGRLEVEEETEDDANKRSQHEQEFASGSGLNSGRHSIDPEQDKRHQCDRLACTSKNSSAVRLHALQRNRLAPRGNSRSVMQLVQQHAPRRGGRNR